ncbi:Hypothetical protein FKW44_010734 [Caligus rogercresseyi]|uniref:Uncharacterized protein n=1 Tax=Caligus rogercresseyi TaxID=217165 RepID=A0A7T8HH04_CALRO|nr:Hypothetical protein FKW44_010734 [Caligus rogercresseyi]
MRLLKSHQAPFYHHQRGEEDYSRSQRYPKVTRRKRTLSTWLPSEVRQKLKIAPGSLLY